MSLFHAPWQFGWLLVLLVVCWLAFRPKRKSALLFSSTSIASQLLPTIRQRLLWVPDALAVIGILMLIVGLAQPREGRERTVSDSDGIAIELVVDRSGSMRALDFQINEQNVDRLSAIKQVASEFVEGDGVLDGRYSDLVGLVVFAGYADALAPPTLDHAYLVNSLYNTEIVSQRDEDGTAIGDAIALAVEKLTSLGNDAVGEIKSKVIILLTDGENSAGELEPLEAAEIAQAFGIKIYTIGVGTDGLAPIPVRDSFTGQTFYRQIKVTIDEETLQTVASVTGGQYFRATDTNSLKRIYAEIDAMEKSKVESTRYTDYRELAVQDYRNSWVYVPPVIWLALACLSIRQFLVATFLREVS